MHYCILCNITCGSHVGFYYDKIQIYTCDTSIDTSIEEETLNVDIMIGFIVSILLKSNQFSKSQKFGNLGVGVILDYNDQYGYKSVMPYA